MLVNNRYKIFKKDIEFFNGCYFCQVYDVKNQGWFFINHNWKYIFYSQKEVLKIVFDLFIKVLKNEFNSYFEKMEFMKNNNIDIDFMED